MIVVDTTVWVDFFNGRPEPHVDALVELIEQDAGVALTDVILTEILQGLRSESDVDRVERTLDVFEVLRLETLADFKAAAALHRTARRGGLTIRKTVDCLIAAVCIREAVPLLHNDGDFDRLASCTELVIHSIDREADDRLPG